MRTIVAGLCLGFLACGGAETLDVPEEPACELVPLDLAANPSVPCLYQLPAGAPCDAISVYVDDVEQPADAYTIVCGAGQVRMLGRTDCVDAAVMACIVK